ncbi:MAG: glycosyltransferase, partial [Isosphaeraceae bacterium]
SSIPGNRRLIQDFRHGRLAPAGDPAGMARVVVEQWTHFDRAFQMSRSARRRVQEEYSIRAVARKHLDLFQKLVLKND